MVRFTVHTLGGPCRDIIMTMTEMFLAAYDGPPDGDLDYAFAEYITSFSMGQGKILDWHPSSSEEIQ